MRGAEVKLAISVFRGARDNAPKAASFAWPEFVDALLPHEFKAPDSKLACDAFSPASYPPDVTRGNANVEALSMFVADLDGVPDGVLEVFGQAVERHGWACLMHSTWSNARKPNCVRAILPFSRPVEPDEWPEVYEAINAALGGYSDPACKDPSRLYFGAFAPDEPADRDAVWSHVFEGAFVDPDALLGNPPRSPAKAPDAPDAPDIPSGGETVSRAQLDRFAKALGRKRDDKAQEHGALLRKVVDGEPFAEPGARDNTIFALSLTLADRWPEAVPESLAQHFGASLGLMAKQADECPTVEQVAYKIDRAQQAIAEAIRKAEDAHRQALAQRIRDAFGTDRETPYTDEEIESFGPRPRWLVQKGKNYYCRVADAYRGPYTSDEALNAAIRDLSPAATAGVDLFTITATGIRKPKNLERLVRDYGFIAADVSVSLSAQKAYFDERSRTIVEAPCPLRDIKPKYHAEIDAWLEALAQEKAHLLKAWIACVTRLDVPCTALFLTGHKHTGKTLLPEGLSRLWTALGFPTPLEDVLGTNFNDAQLRCPLVFADERLPTDHRGRVLNAELRHYIQARRRPLRRKFLSNADMLGAVRLVISANNEEILATTENLSNHDIGAIVDRYLHIVCDAAAYSYLQKVDASDWVTGNKIAEHALWLRDNFVWQPNGRFLVHGDDAELHSRLISSSGIRSAVLQFCVGYLLDPGPLDNNARGQHWIRVYQGRLCVNTQALVKCWSTYVTNEACPTTGRMSSAIAALATQERVRLSVPGKGRPNYRVIDRDHLIAWAESNGYGTREQVETALAVDTEENAKHLAPN
jgi:hypothetical protein